MPSRFENSLIPGHGAGSTECLVLLVLVPRPTLMMIKLTKSGILSMDLNKGGMMLMRTSPLIKSLKDVVQVNNQSLGN
jgi:hypothetical protein